MLRYVFVYIQYIRFARWLNVLVSFIKIYCSVTPPLNLPTPLDPRAQLRSDLEISPRFRNSGYFFKISWITVSSDNHLFEYLLNFCKKYRASKTAQNFPLPLGIFNKSHEFFLILLCFSIYLDGYEYYSPKNSTGQIIYKYIIKVCNPISNVQTKLQVV